MEAKETYETKVLPMESSSAFGDKLAKLFSHMKVEIQKLHENEIAKLGHSPRGSESGKPLTLWDTANAFDSGGSSGIQDVDARDSDPLERSISSSSRSPEGILKNSSKPRFKKPMTGLAPLRRTFTNLSVLSTTSAGPVKKQKRPKVSQDAKVEKDMKEDRLSDLSETDSEESDDDAVQALPSLPSVPDPKPSQPERRRSVQISDFKEVREPKGLPISIPRARSRRISVVSNMSKLSASSFFMQEKEQTGMLGNFLRDPESSYAAYLFANLWNYFIAVTVLLSLSQTIKEPPISGLAVGIVEAVIESIFLVECVAEIVVEIQMQRFEMSKAGYSVVDLLAVAPLPIRAVTGLVIPTLTEAPFYHYTLVCLVPMLRLLKLIRRFGQIQLLAHVFRQTGDALKFLLFLLATIVLLFSTLLYIFEPDVNVDSMFTAMWVSTVTVTTVGYGDITPITLSGKMLMGGLCFFSSLFMAMPISVLGNAMSHAWTDRNRILLMARTRQRLKRHGFTAEDLPRLFRQYDGNQTGDLTMDEFSDMIVKMKVGMGPREAEELFELFDMDGSGGIDDKEFMKGLFPDDYRRIFLRSESMRKTTTGVESERSLTLAKVAAASTGQSS